MDTQNSENRNAEHLEPPTVVFEALATLPAGALIWETIPAEESNPALMETIEFPIDERGAPLS